MMDQEVLSRPFGANGTVSFFPDKKGLFEIDLPQIRVSLMPTKINAAAETGALLRRCREHQTLALPNAFTFNTQSTLPFGSEPQFFREFHLAGAVMTAVSDIRIGGKMNVREIRHDGLHISGAIAKVGFSVPDSEKTGVEWTSLPAADAEVVYDAPAPFVSLIFETESGAQLEFSHGEDLWRLMRTESECSAVRRFSVRRAGDGYDVERVIFSAAEPQVLSQRTFRAKWHIAYAEACPVQSAPAPLVVWSAQDGVSSECLLGNAGRLFRKKIREAAHRPAENRIVLTDYAPHFCLEARHCGRAGKTDLLHWDLTELIELYIWANRQLAPAGGSFAVASDSVYPALRVLGEPALLGGVMPPEQPDGKTLRKGEVSAGNGEKLKKSEKKVKNSVKKV